MRLASTSSSFVIVPRAMEAPKLVMGVQKVEILGLGDILESVCTSFEACNHL